MAPVRKSWATPASTSATRATAGASLSSTQLPLGQSIRLLVRSSKAYWIVNLANFGDGIAYFGILTLLTRFLGTRLGMPDEVVGLTVSMYTGLVTLFMVNGGKVSDQMGVRRAITWSLATCALGRCLLTAAPNLPLPQFGNQMVAWAALGVMAFGTGVLQPALYAGVKEYTDERTSSVGWSLLYAFMNLGIVAAELVSPILRADWGWGIDGVFLAFSMLTIVLWLVNLVFFTSAMEEKERVTPAPTGVVRTRGFFQGLAFAVVAALGLIRTLVTGVHLLQDRGVPQIPLRLAIGVLVLVLALLLIRYLSNLDTRFAFFIFILLPVRTLFAHQWLTLPDYVFRCFDEAVSKRFEWISGLNPTVVAVAVPLIAAATLRWRVIDVMIVGTAISAITTFLLVPPPNLYLLLLYVVVFSLGEAVWASRFLEYVSALAPPGKTGAYMGVANLPWFLAKFTTGFYSGMMLARYVPKEGPRDPGQMWLIYALFTLISPLGLILARRWILSVEGRSQAAESGKPDGTQPTRED